MITTRHLALLAAGTLSLSACGGGSGETTQRLTTVPAAPYGAQVASYDLAADGPQRFLVGLIGTDGGTLVGGTVDLDFTFFGATPDETASGATASDLEGVTATFLPVAGGLAPSPDDGPRLRVGDEGIGVYEAIGVRFAEAGFWNVTVHAQVGGADVALEAAFEVQPAHQIVDAGDPAPRTLNLLPGSTEAPAKAIDSRATDDGAVPDPELHRVTVADAIATGKPTIVVVSTPVFCVSRFCGPITDSVQALADDFGDRANFVHIEVWKDFESNVLNNSAAEWIYPNDAVDPSEPWVFLVDGTGTVVQRWDNVANQAAVSDALSALLG